MKRMLSIAMLALLACSTVFAQDRTAKEESAKQSAKSWLALVDRGEYGASWQEASSFFKSKISKANWETALKQARAPLGVAGSRTLLGAQFQTDLPNVPKGEYVIIQYKTEIAGGGLVVETITPMLDKDGKWRVSGYFIKPAQ
jgi:opacity protein-like surface antigen